MGIDFTVKVDLPVDEIMADFGIGGAVQREWDYIVLNGMRKYLPKREGILEASGDINTVLGSGQIVYNTPYARRLFYNPQYNFSQEKNALAGGQWAQRWANDNMKAATNQLQDFIKGR